jgi:hypothetical protein
MGSLENVKRVSGRGKRKLGRSSINQDVFLEGWFRGHLCNFRSLLEQ